MFIEWFKKSPKKENIFGVFAMGLCYGVIEWVRKTPEIENIFGVFVDNLYILRTSRKKIENLTLSSQYFL
jgi:hypothetical protein